MGPPPTKLNQSSLCQCGHALRDHYPGKRDAEGVWAPGRCQVLSCKRCQATGFQLRGTKPLSGAADLRAGDRPEPVSRGSFCVCEHSTLDHLSTGKFPGCQRVGCECTWAPPTKAEPEPSIEVPITVDRKWRNGVKVVDRMETCSCGHRWKWHDENSCTVCRCKAIFRQETEAEAKARVHKESLVAAAKVATAKASEDWKREHLGTWETGPDMVTPDGKATWKCHDPLTPMAYHYDGPCRCKGRLPTSLATGATGVGEVLEPCATCGHPRKEHGHGMFDCHHKTDGTHKGSWSKCSCPGFRHTLMTFRWVVPHENPAVMAEVIDWRKHWDPGPVLWAAQMIEDLVESNCGAILTSIRERGFTHDALEAVEAEADTLIKMAPFSGVTSNLRDCIDNMVADTHGGIEGTRLVERTLPVVLSFVLSHYRFGHFINTYTEDPEGADPIF